MRSVRLTIPTQRLPTQNNGCSNPSGDQFLQTATTEGIERSRDKFDNNLKSVETQDHNGADSKMPKEQHDSHDDNH